MNPSLSRDNIKRLTDKHITRYEGRIALGKDPTYVSRGNIIINVKECEKYLALWLGIRAKDHVWNNLTGEERSEVFDALDAEE